MLQSGQALLQCRIRATDGPAGSLYDLYFDDRDQKIIFAVVRPDRGRLAPHVMVPTESLGAVNTKLGEVTVTLTARQIRGARRWSSITPIYPQQDDAANDSSRQATPENGEAHRNHIRSLREVSEYGLWGLDGKLGDIVDFIVVDANWSAPYLIIEVPDAEGTRKVILPTNSITSINWYRKRVTTTFSRRLVRASPYFPPDRQRRRDPPPQALS
jgi:hypothetical protein